MNKSLEALHGKIVECLSATDGVYLAIGQEGVGDVELFATLHGFRHKIRISVMVAQEEGEAAKETLAALGKVPGWLDKSNKDGSPEHQERHRLMEIITLSGIPHTLSPPS